MTTLLMQSSLLYPSLIFAGVLGLVFLGDKIWKAWSEKYRRSMHVSGGSFSGGGRPSWSYTITCDKCSYNHSVSSDGGEFFSDVLAEERKLYREHECG